MICNLGWTKLGMLNPIRETRAGLDISGTSHYNGKAVEVYRSGHNGPDSKSGRVKALVGSNPTASAKKSVPRSGDRSFWLRLRGYTNPPAKAAGFGEAAARCAAMPPPPPSVPTIGTTSERVRNDRLALFYVNPGPLPPLPALILQDYTNGLAAWAGFVC